MPIAIVCQIYLRPYYPVPFRVPYGAREPVLTSGELGAILCRLTFIASQVPQALS